MKNRDLNNALIKYPQLGSIFSALEEFKKTGNTTIKCLECNTILSISKDVERGIIETNCACGKSKSRFRWDPKKN